MTTAENTIAITSAVRTGKMKNGPIGTSEATAKVSARMSAPWSGLWPSSIVRPSSFSTMVLRRTFGSRAISAATRFAAGSARPSFSSMYATSASDSSGRSWTSRRSFSICARKISRWLRELMYSPAAMERTSASAAAIPATRTVYWCVVAVATVMTTTRMLVTPSCAPKMASRTSLSRSASRRSAARWSASQRFER